MSSSSKTPLLDTINDPAQLRSLEGSRPRPRTPLWNEIENAFGIYLSKANSGELSAEDAMNQANQEITKIIERGK